MSTETVELVAPTVKVRVGLHFEKYIGLPFWTETNEIINISKDVHPKLGEAKKEQALLASLEKRGYTKKEYERMVKRSARPFYTIDDSDDGEGEIIIPERVLQSFINNASQEAPKVIPRIANKGLTFIGVRVVEGHLRTGKTKADAKSFDRFVKNAESNQRMFCSQKYIEEFKAEGTLKLDTTIIKSDDLRKLMEYGGKYYGIGSARPQGYGRFMISYWDII